jgi:hypothetical protein
MSTTRSRITCAGVTNTGTLVQTGAAALPGTVAATTSIAVGTSGTAITKMIKGIVEVTLAATAADAEETVQVTITGAGTTDALRITPLDAAMETGVAVVAAWVSAADTVKIRVSNRNAVSALNGSTANWNYCLIQS